MLINDNSRVRKNYFLIKLNGMLTDWFPVLSGVRQGNSSSPTIFAFFINNLIEGLKAVNKGIKFNDNVLCCLTFADEVLILAENENDLQNLLNYVYDWCRKWRLLLIFLKPVWCILEIQVNTAVSLNLKLAIRKSSMHLFIDNLGYM